MFLDYSSSGSESYCKEDFQKWFQEDSLSFKCLKHSFLRRHGFFFWLLLSIQQHQRSKESKEVPSRNLSIPSCLSLGHTDTAFSQPSCNLKKNKQNEVPLIVPHFRLFLCSLLCWEPPGFQCLMSVSFPLWYFRAGNLHFLELTKHTLHLGWVHIQPQLISINRLPEQSLSQQLVCLKARLMLIRDYNKSQVSTQCEEHTG